LQTVSPNPSQDIAFYFVTSEIRQRFLSPFKEKNRLRVTMLADKMPDQASTRLARNTLAINTKDHFSFRTLAPLFMGLRVMAQQIRVVRAKGCGLAFLVLFSLFPLRLHSQDTEKQASLRGAVRDSQGKTVVGATVRLQRGQDSQTQMVRTDSQGNYNFPAIGGGVYVLRAEMAGYEDTEIPSLFLAPQEAKNLDLILLPAKHSTNSQSASTQVPEFFDEPQFSVAGVTDTTNLGGHGSDAIVRTRESLAKETVSLGKAPSPPRAGAESEESLRESVERDPRSFEANHLLGKVLDENGKARDAIPYLERAGELKPGDYENSYALALANAHAGNYEKAGDRAVALVADHDTGELHHLLGDLQERRGNSLEAVREYQRAAELDPRETYLFDWGSELLLHHAPEPALQVFTKGNRLFPKSARMLIGLGASFFTLGSYDQAVQQVCAASDLNPNDSIPYLFLGKMQSAEATPSDKIIEKLQRFLALQPKNAEANYFYAAGLWKLQAGSQDPARAAQVESLLNHAIRVDPKFAAAYLQLGIVHSVQKKYRTAISEFLQAIQSDPTMEEAHYRLAHAYQQIGDTAKAEAELQLRDQLARDSAQEVERKRHEIRQFVYILRDPAPDQVP
jgi:tetratricopeptide (TPR) repeat protein